MHRFFLSIAGLCILAVAGEVKAGFIPAIDFASGNGEGGEATAASTQGSKFTIGNTAFTVDALAIYYPHAAGETVRIYQDGTTVNLVSMAIPSTSQVSSPSAQGNEYEYQAITPITLIANTTYDIVEDFSADDGLHFHASGLSGNPDITFSGSISTDGEGLFPTTDGFNQGAYFGPSFEGIPAPEPSSFVLAGLGIVISMVCYAPRRRWAVC
jgi:hypothetical protein